MRFWLVILMVAASLPLVPLLRTSIKRHNPRLLYNYLTHPTFNTTADKSAITYATTSSATTQVHHLNMATEASAPISSSSAAPPSEITPEQQLPKLSTEDLKVFNKMAVMMEYYHNHFRQTWRALYNACENNQRPKNMSLNQFMNMGLQLCHHLTAHHNIEEYHIFPVLGRRMTEFSQSKSPSDPRAQLMLLQHKQIHAGLDRLEKYLDECKSGKQDFKLTGDGSLKEIMDGFGAVLWEHLDEEVRLLGADNMRKYWSKQEMQGMNF